MGVATNHKSVTPTAMPCDDPDARNEGVEPRGCAWRPDVFLGCGSPALAGGNGRHDRDSQAGNVPRMAEVSAAS